MTARYWDSWRPQNAYHRRCLEPQDRVSLNFNFVEFWMGTRSLQCLGNLRERNFSPRRREKKKEKKGKILERFLSSRSIRGRKRKKGDRNAFWGWKLDRREGRWPKITACTVVFSSLLRETRQAVELIGDKIEQFTCAAAKRRESVLSFDREARGIFVLPYLRM